MRIRGVDVARSRMVCPRLAKSRPSSCNTLDIPPQSAHILHEIGSPLFRTLSLSPTFRRCRQDSRSRLNRRGCSPATGWMMTYLHAPPDCRT